MGVQELNVDSARERKSAYLEIINTPMKTVTFEDLTFEIPKDWELDNSWEDCVYAPYGNTATAKYGLYLSVKKVSDPSFDKEKMMNNLRKVGNDMVEDAGETFIGDTVVTSYTTDNNGFTEYYEYCSIKDGKIYTFLVFASPKRIEHAKDMLDLIFDK